MQSRSCRSNSIPCVPSSAVKFQGLLEKHGKLPGSFMVKKLWCVLDENRLSFYKNSSKVGPCCGFIDVSRVQSVLKTSKGNGFDVVTCSGTQTLAASSAEERDEWVKALQEVMSVAGRRRDSMRLSVVSCEYETHSDDEANKSTFTPMFNAVFEVGPNQLTPLEPSAAAAAAAGDDDAASDDQTTGAEAVDGVGSSKFSYMNAADVAVALQTGGSGSASVARVKSVHSDDEAEEKLDPDQSAEDLNRQRSSPPPVPTPDVHSKTLLAPETHSDSTLDATENNAETIEKKKSFDDALFISNESLKSSTNLEGEASRVEDGQASESVVQNTDIVASDKKSTNSTANDKDVVKKSTYQRQVTMRRDSKIVQQSDTVKNVPVVEVHINADLTPTSSSDFQLEPLSSEAGSAVEKLRQFLAETENSRSSVRRSAHNVPTAIQPGKAFDSLKYFLSTLEQ